VSPRISIRLLAIQSDERLVRLVREGQERAFETLVHRYRRPLQRYCRRLGLSDVRAEDVLQLAFLNAWLALSAGTEVRELKPWLYRIAHNAAINAFRGAAERNTVSEEVASVSGGRADTEDLDHRIAVCDALADVAALPTMQRQAILLTAIEGKTHDEVAGLLGINQDAVRGLLYRARTTLRSAAAFAPQPLLNLASDGAGTAGSASARLSELTVGGALGLTGALLKGAAVAITAGVLVSGAVMRLHEHPARGSSGRALASTLAPLGSDHVSIATSAGASSALAGDAPTVSSGARVPVQARRALHARAPAFSRAADGRRAPRSAPQPPAELVPPEAERHALRTREQHGTHTGADGAGAGDGGGSLGAAPHGSSEDQAGNSDTSTRPATDGPNGRAETDGSAVRAGEPPTAGAHGQAPHDTGETGREGSALAADAAPSGANHPAY
jgi:RNA polymerase sigma factor (sigma-70 family)